MKNQSVTGTLIALGNTKEKSTTSADEISGEGLVDPPSIAEVSRETLRQIAYIWIRYNHKRDTS